MKFLSLSTLLILSAVILSGCSESSFHGPVRSEISTYDTTFTGDSYATAKAEKISFTPAAPLKTGEFRVRPEVPGNKPYFIEFRARSAMTYGHASVVFGKLRNGKVPVDAKGVLDPRLVQVSGLHPASNDPAVWAKGHAVPVPAETGPSDGDFEDAYVTARYRVDLTEEEFRKVVSVIRKHKYSYAYWYAPNYASNCLGYIGSIAKHIGLKAPVVPSLPKDFVNQMKRMNG